jgi:hypothetical protein
MNVNVMNPKLIAIAIVVVVVIAVAIALYMHKRKKNTAGLRDRFGPEYDRPFSNMVLNERLKRSWRSVKREWRC